jgi:acyl-CoA synthetase (NDP forming)
MSSELSALSAAAVDPTPDRGVSPLVPLLAPRGVVVVGASSEATKLGGVMAASLASYADGPVLVNRRGGEGLHTTIAGAVSAAPTPVDLAVLCVPASACATAIEECAKAGVRAALVCAGGFAEAGGEGIEHERRLLEAARASGVRVLGPNTSGFFVPGSGLRASFVPGVARLKAGGVAVLAASGGLNHALSFALERQGVGVSIGIGIGSGIDVTAADVLRHLAHDDDTRTILLHIESVPNGPDLLSAVREATAAKPVVALVVGRHDLGEFAQSHTGALATSWRTTRALLREAGAVLVDDEDDLVTAGSVLACTRLVPSPQSGVALMTAQAGPGLLVTDALYGHGIALPKLSAVTRTRLAELLPPLTFQANPVDTGRPGPRHGEVLAAVARDPAIDLIAVYGLTEPVVDLPMVVSASDLGTTTAVLGLDGPTDEVASARAEAHDLGLPVVVGARALSNAVHALVEDARLVHHRLLDEGTDAAPDPDGRLRLPNQKWTESAAKQALHALGVDTPSGALCCSQEDATLAASRLGWPLAVKISDADILHKSDSGGVHLGVGNAEQLARAVASLQKMGARGFLVEQMAPPGTDLVVGARRDPVFGPVVLLGVGGVATEVYADVAIASAPNDATTLSRLPDQLAARELLDDYRGLPPVDRAALGRICALLGDLLVANDHVDDIEINPLRAHAGGLLALDAVIVQRSRVAAESEEPMDTKESS